MLAILAGVARSEKRAIRFGQEVILEADLTKDLRSVEAGITRGCIRDE